MRKVWRICDRCNGSGGPDDRWDEDEQRWHSYVCGSCGGTGGRSDWVEDAS